MTWEQLGTRWTEFAGSACAHWSRLTDEDWKSVAGRKEQLVDRIQERYGVSRKTAERQADAWSNALLDIAESKPR